MAVIRKDSRGLYLVTNGAKYRPGKVSGILGSTSDEGVHPGDRIDAKFILSGGMPVAKVKINGESRIWPHEDLRRVAVVAPPAASDTDSEPSGSSDSMRM